MVSVANLHAKLIFRGLSHPLTTRPGRVFTALFECVEGGCGISSGHCGLIGSGPIEATRIRRQMVWSAVRAA